MRKRRFLDALKLVVVLITVAYVLFSLHKNYQGIRALELKWGSILVLALTVLIWLTIVFSGSVIWWLLIKGDDTNVTFKAILRIFLLTQIGKYLPGNVGHYVGRVAMVAKLDVPLSRTTASLIFEVLWALSVSGLLGAIGGMLLFDVDFPVSWTVLLLIGVGAFSLPLVIPLAIKTARKYTNLAIFSNISTANLEWTVSVKVFLVYFFNFWLLGCMCWLQLRWVFDVQPPDLLTLMCFNAMIWVIGYVVPGAPGGIGVRESATIILLSPFVGAVAASGVAISMRLASVVGDLLGFLCGLGLGGLMRHSDRSKAAS